MVFQSCTRCRSNLTLNRCRTLTDFLVAEIGKGNDVAEAADGVQSVPARDLLHAFSAFCSGTPSLEKSEQAQLVRVLSASKRPDFVTLINRQDIFIFHILF